jgi:hypothetical protein
MHLISPLIGHNSVSAWAWEGLASPFDRPQFSICLCARRPCISPLIGRNSVSAREQECPASPLWSAAIQYLLGSKNAPHLPFDRPQFSICFCARRPYISPLIGHNSVSAREQECPLSPLWSATIQYLLGREKALHLLLIGRNSISARDYLHNVHLVVCYKYINTHIWRILNVLNNFKHFKIIF